ncbi:MAG TPA: serine hydrolase domain-containing protein [Chitinophagaceae bacterium]|nr:serine hydrolase domain-containing protein [Chitinophagaceae bacterium]
MLKKLTLLISLAAGSIANAQSWQDTVALIDKIFSRYADANPGAQLAVSRNGEIIYLSARGMADLEHNVSLTKQSKIEAGSVSKQFTAAVILLLEQQGKLSLNDDVRKYVPEVPDYGNTITIRHLLNHTSGLKDWGSIGDLAGWPRGTKAYTNEDALYIISLQKTLNNKPGDEYIYSNSNYNLQAIIVQRVSGISLADFSKKYIFEPAGMKNTEWRDNYRKVVPNRAIAYSRSGSTYLTNMPNEYVYGNGGLLTTAEDLLIWNNYYLTGKLGTPSLLPKQLATSPLNNGKRNSYASGLFVDSVNGWAAIRHDGATAGYRSNLEYFPQLGLSIAWLSNTSQPDLGNVPSEVRNLLVKNLNPATPNSPTSSMVDPKSFLPYLGAYRYAKTGAGWKIYIRDTLLYSTPNGKLIPLTANVAALGRGRIIFSDKPRGFQLISASDTFNFVGVDSAQITDKNINDYAGIYYSEETESKTKLLVKDGKVMVEQRGNQVALTPVYKDGFSFPGGDIYFMRDKKGYVNNFFITISRARHVEFKKQPGYNAK